MRQQLRLSNRFKNALKFTEINLEKNASYETMQKYKQNKL